jgi:hypothetical protein
LSILAAVFDDCSLAGFEQDIVSAESAKASAAINEINLTPIPS